MKRILSLLILVCTWCMMRADNFVMKYGQSSKCFVPQVDKDPVGRADALFAEDYLELFGNALVHTNHIEDARIIACTYDHAALRKFAKLRGISFESLAGKHEAFVLKVHNNGTQLFVVGSDAKGLAYGLMSLSRMWGVSPFRWWADTPALPVENFDLGVVYEECFEASVPNRKLVIDGVDRHNSKLQDLALRLRATEVCSSEEASLTAGEGLFAWNLSSAVQPYLGLGLTLDHPEHMRIEAVRAYHNGHDRQWLLHLQPQMGGELQTFLFFDMAWDIASYEDPYAVDRLEDLHYSQMSGLNSTWSQLWNDYFDLSMNLHPELPLSVESLRRGIGEAQSLALQLSFELNNKVLKPIYSQAFFRTVEYPLNVMTTQIQRLCNMQLLSHGMGTQWSVNDCSQRIRLLTNQLPEIVTPKWKQMFGSVAPAPDFELSLKQQTDEGIMDLPVGSHAALSDEDVNVVLYRSDRATGTQIKPFEALQLPLNYQTDGIRLLISLLPVKTYGKSLNCIVTVDNEEPQLVTIDQTLLGSNCQLSELYFEVDSSIERHRITFRTTSDGIYLQRVWLEDMK